MNYIFLNTTYTLTIATDKILTALVEKRKVAKNIEGIPHEVVGYFKRKEFNEEEADLFVSSKICRVRTPSGNFYKDVPSEKIAFFDYGKNQFKIGNSIEPFGAKQSLQTAIEKITFSQVYIIWRRLPSPSQDLSNP